MQKSIETFNQTLEKSHLWLKDLKRIGNFNSEEEAYSILRATLHAIRDRLIVNQAVHLAAELPMLIRGLYYEGWKPEATPQEMSKNEFIETVRANLHQASNTIDPETGAKAIFHLLERKISSGEISHIKSELPTDLKEFWND